MGAAGGYGALGKPSPFPNEPVNPRPNMLRPFLTEQLPIMSASGKKVGEVEQISFNRRMGVWTA